MRVASPVAAVVGTLLTGVNQGGILLGGSANWVTWVRVGVNFVTPFVVASIGYLRGLRTSPAVAEDDPPGDVG